MGRKIGEIFEYNGEWYQCVGGAGCYQCAFNRDENTCTADNPHCTCRSDKKDVVFKKLEKVGEPIEFARGLNFQRYQLADSTAFYEGDTRLFFNAPTKTFVYIEIKTKEDMEEKKLNLKPFDIQKAREGKPVCTRDGRKARITCFDLKNEEYPIVAAIRNDSSETLLSYTINGEIVKGNYKSDKDLMMFSEKKEGWVNIVRGSNGSPHMGRGIFQSKEEAENAIKAFSDNLIDTVKINWEE